MFTTKSILAGVFGVLLCVVPVYAQEQETAEISLEEAVELIQARYLDERREGVAAIGQLDEAGKRKAAPLLEALLDDSNWQTQMHAAMALRGIGDTAAGVVPSLLKRMKTAAERNDASLYRLLGDTVITLRGFEPRNGRDDGMNNLFAMMRTAIAEGNPALFDTLSGTITGEGGADAVPTLINLLEGDDATLQTQALKTLEGIGEDAAAAVPALTDIVREADNDDRLRITVNALANIGSDAGDALEALLERGHAADRRMQNTIQQAISRIKTENKPPQVSDVSASVREGESIEISLEVTDEDDLPVALKAEIAEQPEHGSLERVSDFVFRYNTELGFSGNDVFAWVGNDGQDKSELARVQIEIIADDAPPRIAAAHGAGENKLRVVFDKPVSEESAARAAAYSLSPAVAVSSATLNEDGQSVTLETAALTDGGEYTLTAQRISDTAAAANTADELTAQFTYHSAAPGLAYQYYEAERRELTAAHADDTFAQMTPQKSGSTEAITIDLRERQNDIGIVFSGWINISEAGEYTFYATSDDGSFLFIGDELIVDNGGLHGMQERSGTIELEPGMHPFRVTWFQAGGGLGLITHWQGPGFDKQEFPPYVFSHIPIAE